MIKVTCKDDPGTGTTGPKITAPETMRIKLEGGSVKTFSTLVVGDKIRLVDSQPFFEIEAIENLTV
jgi:hypothetical protein